MPHTTSVRPLWNGYSFRKSAYKEEEEKEEEEEEDVE